MFARKKSCPFSGFADEFDDVIGRLDQLLADSLADATGVTDRCHDDSSHGSGRYRLSNRHQWGLIVFSIKITGQPEPFRGWWLPGAHYQRLPGSYTFVSLTNVNNSSIR